MAARRARTIQDFESWRGGIELSIVRFLEQVHKMPYWVARDVAQSKSLTGARDFYRDEIEKE